MITNKALLFAIPLAAAIGCVTGQSASSRRGGLDSEQVSKLPETEQKAYQVFASRCSRCHTLSRPLAAQITNFQHWKAYVGRMRRHPGSGISPSDAETILVFLKYYTEQKKSEEAGGKL